ncbi:hypothetical protein ACE6H2_010744 [Prunus campanulata]
MEFVGATCKKPLHALKSMEPNKETISKTPIKVNQSVEIKTNSGGKTVEPHKTLMNKFDHSKMFQLLPTQIAVQRRLPKGIKLWK